MNIDIKKLDPILYKESILKTANARELRQLPQDVLQRYNTYALTHIPLGDTARQLTNLERVITQNKMCAVGSIVGPYGYGKTSTAVHLWHELRERHVLAIPPYLWLNLPEFLDAVYYWVRFEFELGPKAFIEPLENLYQSITSRSYNDYVSRLGEDNVRELVEQGRLLLEIRPEDVVGFLNGACTIAMEAGYKGLAVFTDELQATLAAYKPHRDQFYADLFQIVRDILGTTGNWIVVFTMDEDTEGNLARLRSDLLQRLQKSALYFRVRDVYNRREYPAELWKAYETRFGFDGDEIVPLSTLEAIGQVAARPDLGAGPRMVTNALALAIQHFGKTNKPYTPFHFVEDFLTGQMVFDHRGKFISAVRKALDSAEVRDSEALQRVVRLLAAFPSGCPPEMMQEYQVLDAFRAFPPLARKELIAQLSGGYILRYLAEQEIEPEQIEQRLAKDFVNRYAPGKSYAIHALAGFMQQITGDQSLFGGWREEKIDPIDQDGLKYHGKIVKGSFDTRNFPGRRVGLLFAAVAQSPVPHWKRWIDDVDLELRFELNYSLAATEPSRLMISPDRPDIAVFQFNLLAFEAEAANRILPEFLQSYYPSDDQLTSLLSLALIEHLDSNRGDLPEDQARIGAVIAPLRQYVLTVLLGDNLTITPSDYASQMVGAERIKDLFKQQCRQLYPNYKTLMGSSKWEQNLQQYNYAIQAVGTHDGLSIARGRRPWIATKEEVADALRIPGKRLTNLEGLLDTLDDFLERKDFSGRSAGSQVTLLFKLHPLEDEFLAQLDRSTRKLKKDGLELNAIPADDLIRSALQRGYTRDEILPIIELLESRKFIERDPKRGLIVRTVDTVDDLREAVAAQLRQLEMLIENLKRVLGEFDSDHYPLSRLKLDWEKAKERDELENLSAEIRLQTSQLNAYAASQSERLKGNLKKETDNLQSLVDQGVPTWLSREFLPSPLREALENRRKDLVAAYQSALDDIRKTQQQAWHEYQALAGSPVEIISHVAEALPRVTKQSRTLKTRLQSYDDRRDDFDAWRAVSELAVDLDRKSLVAANVYNEQSLRLEVEQLWKGWRERFNTQPEKISGMHQEAQEQIAGQISHVASWLATRRNDFENRQRSYQALLTELGYKTELRVPFDQEHPSQSYEALEQTVLTRMEQYLSTLLGRLKSEQEAARYANIVQKLPLTEVENRLRQVAESIARIKGKINLEIVGNFDLLQKEIIVELRQLEDVERGISRELADAINQQPEIGPEAILLQQLETFTQGQQTDLRSLILLSLDNGVNVELDTLMKDLQSLFQKNQISIYLTVRRASGGED
jgi:hypothetical protein